ncbi:hypothetical protein JCM10296v2_001743 [Rhodotorula toruloides]
MKRLFLFCDGTLEDAGTQKDLDSYTNIGRLSRAVKELDERENPPVEQIKFYQSLQEEKNDCAFEGKIDSSVDWKADAAELTKIAVKLVEEWSAGEDLASMGIDAEQWKEDLTKVCKEVARAPPSTTLPQTSALLGGLVAQEAIKVITKQYIPRNGTCVWDGIRRGTGVVDA